MKKVRLWCGQPSDRGRLKNRTEQNNSKLWETRPPVPPRRDLLPWAHRYITIPYCSAEWAINKCVLMMSVCRPFIITVFFSTSRSCFVVLLQFLLCNHFKRFCGAGAHLFSPCPFTSSSFPPFYFSLSFIGFTYFLFLFIPSLFTRIVPLRFQAGGRRRRPNLGLVCFVV